jgi:hypothetical protein
MRLPRRIDDYVAALIAKARKALAPRKKFRTDVHSCGRCFLPNLDNIAQVLVAAEGEWFK